ncbi:hypothetical protein TNIN_213041 [Trichonephila inaurata madagascariensis]|uniref:Uncharacterized protein n=1 Tax=Trichonephila inaurata madagascariensis TaxID=2747483 RepID=A0A8X7C8Q6_9ARAC|nr:hypothetical protein TNIN_213041 [Trichonephila inaurata madagascariensis]
MGISILWYNVHGHMVLVKAYYASNNIPTVAQRKLATEFKLKSTGTSVLTIINWIHKFEIFRSVRNDSVSNVDLQKSVKTQHASSYREHTCCFSNATGNQ